MENNTVVAITRSRKSLYLAGAFLVIIIGAAGVYFFIYSQSSGMTSWTRDFVASPAEEIKNPIEYFYEHFSAKNYHVRVIGKDSTEGLSFYYEKGVIVRIDGEGHITVITYPS